MKVRWTPAAKADRVSIFDHIGVHDPHAAVRLDDRFDDAAKGLADLPMLGHAGEIASTRE